MAEAERQGVSKAIQEEGSRPEEGECLVKTFEEALRYVTECKHGDSESEKEKVRIQKEFRDEINESEMVHKMSYAVIGGILDVYYSRDENLEAPQLAEVLDSTFINGLVAGVTVGVYMERAEFDFTPTPVPSRWRRVLSAICK